MNRFARRHGLDSVRRGFSLVELLVAVTIGLVLTLAVTSVLLLNEGRRRNTMAVNDVNQSGAFVAHTLDGIIRSAGSGFSNRSGEVYGCRLNVRRGGAQLLPRTAAWEAPFEAYPQTILMAPVLVAKGASAAGSDIITILRGNAGIGEAPLEVLNLSNPLGVRNTIGLAANDLILIADGEPDCLLMQAGVMTTDTITLTGSGDFHTITGAHRNYADFGVASATTVLVNLGNPGPSGGTPRTPPQFMMYGVGENQTLFSRDILNIESTGPQPLLDGVVEMRVLYGIDDEANGGITSWRDPGVAPFDIATLSNGSTASIQNLNSIIALRVGLILRTSVREREIVAPETIVLFGDLPAALRQSRALSADEQLFRHRVTEVTIPLRNPLMARNMSPFTP